MTGTVLPRGRQVGDLLRYLFREGLADERGLAADHVAPRLIGAWDGDLATGKLQDEQRSRADRRHDAATDATERRPRKTDRLRLSSDERQHLWAHAQHATAAATAHIRVAARSDAAAAGDAAWAAADLLAAVAQVVEGRRGGPYTDAAGPSSRPAGSCAATPWPRRSRLASSRKASAVLRLAPVALPSERRQLLDLAQRLSSLADAVARLRETQRRAAQAAVARQAAEQLQALSRPGKPPSTAPPAAESVSTPSPRHVASATRSSPRRAR